MRKEKREKKKKKERKERKRESICERKYVKTNFKNLCS